MLFNSTQFLVFFPIVLWLYFSLRHKGRLILLLLASYYFYMCWQPKYVVLILLSTAIDFAAGKWMGRLDTKKARKPILIFSLFVNLGLLFFFKYFNFFNEVLADLGAIFESPFSPSVHSLLLPVGISFYTFQTLSYSIDIYNGKIEPEKSFLKFAVFVSFFPQLVAGPIERAVNLLPQFSKTYDFDWKRILDGLHLVLWGFFKKIVIADRLAVVVDTVYASPESFAGPYLILATYLFAFQIYCDFSGYSDIAIGTAKMMGYDLMTNFRTPYFSTSVREFWSRWHISLSTWFRDYVYIPLGGNRGSKFKAARNILITFIVSGFWHGANWTFLIWGAIHGSCLLIERFATGFLKSVPTWMKWFATFHVVLIAWIFFRANTVSDVGTIFCQLGTWSKLSAAEIHLTVFQFRILLTLLVAFIVAEVINYRFRISSSIIQLSFKARFAVYFVLFVIVSLFGIWNSSSFIYFQF
ncbi:MAG: MBOAT family O-acyltransferase [Cyclobacteriaceae bacterium]